jgi:DNA-binding LacI/PurR family transcriptional regulator
MEEGAMASSKRPTLRDVAELAGVSTATVSYVINDGPRRTSSEVRMRVLRAVADLGYHPNGMARNLRQQRSRTIAFVEYSHRPFESLISAFVGSIVGTVVEECSAFGNHVIFQPITFGQSEAPLASLIKSGQIDGLLIRTIDVRPPDDPIVRLILDSQIPTVSIEVRVARDLPSVTFDDEGGGELATRHLIERGHTRIAFMGGGPQHQSSRLRQAGFLRVMQEAGLPVVPAWMSDCDWGMEAAGATILELVHRPDPPTAIFCASDDMAVGAANALVAEGLRIPDDLAIMGFDDSPLSRALRPRLSTVHIPLAEIARRGVHLLRDCIESADIADPHVVLHPELRIRDST